LNQQQLQIARAALWHQNAAPLLTYDDAAPWLDEIGLCLFLPRHTQLPAPAPSFVEACLGATRVTPAAPAIATATELAHRLIDAGRALPLNLLGTFAEQPDFLVTPDALPWVAAVRGDRQWKAAPAGRTSPIVSRTWEALDQHGPQTATELQERIGREVTEAAVLRALIELWTSLRAIPAYMPGAPTRWSLLKDRYAAQLATAANTGQPTAISALLSLYLRSAVAATAEEAEIFLSPLTARSRIRDVVHGMTAARQFGTMSVGSNTLLFVEGSLPEVEPTPEAETGAETAAPAFRPRAAPRRPFDQKREGPPREKKFPPRFADRARTPRPAAGAPRGTFRDRSGPKGYEKRPPATFRRDTGSQPRPGSAGPSGSPSSPGFRPERSPGGRPAPRPGQRPSKPWQKRPGEFRPQQREGRPSFPRRDRPSGPPAARADSRPSQGDRPRFERPAGGRPVGNRPPFGKGPRRDFAPRPFDRPRRPDAEGRPPRAAGESRPPRAEGRPFRPGIKPGERPAAKSGFLRPGPGMPRSDSPSRSGPGKPRFERPLRPGPGQPRTGEAPRRGPGNFGKPKPAFGAKRPGAFGPAKFGKGPGRGPAKFGAGKPRSSGPGAARPGRPSSGPNSGGKFAAGKKFGKSPRPAAGKPRKNRSEKPKREESSE
jgi:23S rRNA pseudouridine2605 synthase